MELLKPILGDTVLMEIHITEPLLNILKDAKTKHSDLNTIFPTLYIDLLVTNSLTFLQTKHCATSFASQEKNLQCLPKPCIVDSVDKCIFLNFKIILSSW